MLVIFFAHSQHSPHSFAPKKSKRVQHLWMMTSLHIQSYLGCLRADYVIWVHKSWPFCLGECWHSTGMVAKVAPHTKRNHKHAQNTKQSTWAAAAALCSGFALSPWKGQRHPKSSRRCSLWVRCRRPALCLCTQWLVLLFGMNFEATSKNRETGGVLALGGRRSINTYNNQMEVGVQGGGYIEEEARPGWNVWGGRGPVVFAVKKSV